MDGIFKSAAFQEFLQKRCEEIIEKDAIYIKLNREILKLEQELSPMLPKEALDKALKIDELTMELIDHIRTLLCRQFYDNSDSFTIIFEGKTYIL